MKIGLIFRQPEIFDSPQTGIGLAVEIASMCGECLLITTDMRQYNGSKAMLFNSFFAAVDGRMHPVDVFIQQQGSIRIFSVNTTEALVFAAAAAGIVRKLLERQEKIDYLHIFDPDDTIAAVVCKTYFRIPFIYSVRVPKELKLAKKDFTALGLERPATAAGSGDWLFAGQLAAAAACYIIDETGDATLWKEFFCPFADKYIQAVPYTDVAFWSAGAALGEARRKARNVYLQDGAAGYDYLAVYDTHLPAVMEQGKWLFVREESDRFARRRLYQAADLYIAGDQAAVLPSMLSAIAAGCLLCVPATCPARQLFTDSDHAKDIYQYFSRQDWQAILAAVADLTQSPGQMTARRQRLQAQAKHQHGLGAAASMYSRLYQGLAPVRLPFLTEMQPAISGIWEGMR